jgi:hypothetical protein
MQSNGTQDPTSFVTVQGKILRNLEAAGDLNVNDFEVLLGKTSEVSEVLQEFHRARRTLGDSGKFTESGLREALADAASRAAANVRRLTDDTVLKEHIRQVRARLAPKPGDPIAALGDLWRQMEARQLLAAQGVADDPLRAAMVYRDAMQRDDHLTMQALETWPLGSPVKDASLLAEGQEARYAASDPVNAKKLAELQVFQQVLGQIAKDALRELPVGEPDVIAQQAQADA